MDEVNREKEKQITQTKLFAYFEKVKPFDRMSFIVICYIIVNKQSFERESIEPVQKVH